MQLIEILFWAGLAALVYTYFGYPAILFILSRSVKRDPNPVGSFYPRVTMIIAAYNEERAIGAKLENCLALDYPMDKIDFIVASDGSVDSTNPIVSAKALLDVHIRLLMLPRGGKAAAINAAMKEAAGEIVVFSDANTIYEPDAVVKLVCRFADAQIGCASGRLAYKNPGKVVSGEGESAYWRYETGLKKMESRLGYVVGANGAIYAIRRELFEPLPSGTINDDFLISMRVVCRGFKSVYIADAIAYEEVAPNVASEFRRHVRDGAGHYIAVCQLAGLLNPLLGLRAFIYWSHRILRWAAPFILIMLFAVNAVLAGRQPYYVLFLFQAGFYVLALVGYANSHNGKAPFLFYAPFYFCNLNLALFFGFLKVITGRVKPAWESTQR